MNFEKELRAQISNFRAALKRDFEPDAEIGCGISWLFKLAPDSPWMDKDLCADHDKLFTEGKKTLREIQLWWLTQGWKRATTWRKKVFYLATLNAVLAWTAARYRGPL